MKMFKYLGIACLLIFISCKGGEQRVNKISERVTKKLELNDAQVAKLNELKSVVIDVQKEFLEGKKERPLETFLNELSGDSFNKAAIDAKVEDSAKKRIENTKKITDKIQNFHASLTSEQKEKLSKMVVKFKEKHEKKKAERRNKRGER